MRKYQTEARLIYDKCGKNQTDAKKIQGKSKKTG